MPSQYLRYKGWTQSELSENKPHTPHVKVPKSCKKQHRNTKASSVKYVYLYVRMYIYHRVDRVYFLFFSGFFGLLLKLPSGGFCFSSFLSTFFTLAVFAIEFALFRLAHADRDWHSFDTARCGPTASGHLWLFCPMSSCSFSLTIPSYLQSNSECQWRVLQMLSNSERHSTQHIQHLVVCFFATWYDEYLAYKD